MVEPSSILIWILAVGCFIICCIPRLNLIPLYSLSTILSLGGIVCSFNEYNAGTIDNSISLVLVITMLSIMIYSLYYTLAEITPEFKKGKW